MFAVMELKHDEGRILIAKKKWILIQKDSYSRTEAVFCYWSDDLNDSPENMQYEYSEKFTGEPALFKVFIIKLTDTIEDAESCLKGRLKYVTKRFRDPADTEVELKKMEAKKKRGAKKELKIHQAKAHEMNVEYLINEVQSQQPSTSAINKSNSVVTAEDVAGKNESKHNKNKGEQSEDENDQKIIEGSDTKKDKKKKKKKKEHKGQEDQASEMVIGNDISEVQPQEHSKSKYNEDKNAGGNAKQEDKMKKKRKAQQEQTNVIIVDNEFINQSNKVEEEKPIEQSLDDNNQKNVEENGKKQGKVKKKKKSKTEQVRDDAMNIEYLIHQNEVSEEETGNKVIVKPILSSHESPSSHEPPWPLEPPLSHESPLSFDVLSLDLPNISYNELFNHILIDGLDLQGDLNISETIKQIEDSQPISSNIAPLSTTVASKPSGAVDNEIINLNSDVSDKNNSEITFDSLGAQNLEGEINNLRDENQKLKNELENANKRNLVLQNYLVAVDERVPETLFIEKDGGRLYRGDVFLNKNQCKVLDNANTDTDFLNNLLVCVFGRETLKTHTLTGKPSNRTKGPAKLKLDSTLVKLVYDIMDARSIAKKTKKLSEREKNAIIGKKISNVQCYKSTNEKKG